MKKIIYSIFIFIILVAVSSGVIFYSRGYRINPVDKHVTSTGILSASSFPDGASIWVDNKLVSATNTSVSLTPAWYNVKITKEGYLPWEKQVKVQGEVVTRIDALLLPTNPSLRAITNTGIMLQSLSPTGGKIAYVVSTDESTPSGVLKSKKGIWLMDLKNGPLGGNSSARQIYQPIVLPDLTGAELSWSPDEKMLIAKFKTTVAKKDVIISALEFNLDNPNSLPTEVVTQLPIILDDWAKTEKLKQEEKLAVLPVNLYKFLSNSVSHITMSPDENRILYLATASSTLAPVITPPVIGSNSTAEVRNVQMGKYYIYDVKEDKNYFLTDDRNFIVPTSLSWYFDSKHVVMVENDAIYIIDYDGTNKRTVYSGPFEDNSVYPWSSGGKLIILTNFHQPSSQPNLYEIDLR